jgi:enterochelin esterase-like enzyme
MKLPRTRHYKRNDAATALKHLNVLSLVTAASCAESLSFDRPAVHEPIGERFTDFLARVNRQRDHAARRGIVDEFMKIVRTSGRPVIEDNRIYFLYQGKAERVGVPSDLNGWNPFSDTMSRIRGTNLFFLEKKVDGAARFEYKFSVDSTWILDPFNSQHAMGGYGPNSEIRMPGYKPPRDIEFRPRIPHGTFDALSFRSRLLGRTHPVFVYLPAGYKNTRRRYPSVYIMDGGEYISLALMHNVLDNLIADGRIRPVIGIFVDPRTDVRNSETSKRMLDYTMSDTFVSFLTTELRKMLLRKYRLIPRPHNTAIMGASLGGLISTYAACTRPDVFGLCAAQSPSYWLKNEAMIELIAASPRVPVKLYVDTGTIRDAQTQTRKMKAVLKQKGYEFTYAEYPESHNWVNWRARVPDILSYFWGKED